LYSLETWKKVVGQKGIEIVIKYTTPIIKFYISQCSADNHAVREAACHCISELCSKIAVINKECMRSHVTEMLDALILCFKDMSWPVRDSACVACGQFVLVNNKIFNLHRLFLKNLNQRLMNCMNFGVHIFVRILVQFVKTLQWLLGMQCELLVNL
jgi:hypothetical protein